MLKKEDCCVFREELRHSVGGREELPDGWATTTEVVSETSRTVLGVSSGQWEEDKETWWPNEEVKGSRQRRCGIVR